MLSENGCGQNRRVGFFVQKCRFHYIMRTGSGTVKCYHYISVKKSKENKLTTG